MENKKIEQERLAKAANNKSDDIGDTFHGKKHENQCDGQQTANTEGQRLAAHSRTTLDYRLRHHQLVKKHKYRYHRHAQDDQIPPSEGGHTGPGKVASSKP